MSHVPTEVLLLLSGGLDSCACIPYYLNRNSLVTALFVDYGQPAAPMEKNAALKISEYYKITLRQICSKSDLLLKDGYIRGRNAFLLNLALMHFSDQSGLISLGIHTGSSYCDCSSVFVDLMQACFDLYEDGSVQIDAPFLTATKQDIWRYSKAQNVPVNLTYSCELGQGKPCGKCLSCKDIEALYAC